jgi:hypothetical protein
MDLRLGRLSSLVSSASKDPRSVLFIRHAFLHCEIQSVQQEKSILSPNRETTSDIWYVELPFGELKLCDEFVDRPSYPHLADRDSPGRPGQL